MTQIKFFLFVVFITVFMTACVDSSDDTPTNPEDTNSILDVASTNGDFSTLVSLLESTGLDETLDGTDSFTVFAPTNAAFAALGDETLSALANDPARLSGILLYHLVPGVTDSSAAIAAAGTQLDTVNGAPIAITAGGTGVGVRVNLSNVTAVDITADNGIIHVIDQVMLPPTLRDLSGNSITTIARTNPNLSTLVSALQASGLDEVLADLNSGVAYTLFAPTNEAFEAIDSDVLARLLNDSDALQEVLLQHVVSNASVDSVTAMTLAGTSVSTASGSTIPIDITQGMLTFGGANVVSADIIAENGIVHLIDQVILGEVAKVSTPSLEGYTLVWSDEFDGPSINTDNWGFQLGDGSELGIPGWGNQELQIYTDQEANASIGMDGDNSVLMITAREDGDGGYTSARLNSSGKVSVRYGKIVGRMKLPETQGFWPAFWMLGDATEVIWPGIGEIDIMELTGDTPDKTFHTVHYVNGEQRYNFVGKDFFNDESFSDGYNEFMIDWTPEYITWYVNGEEAFQLPITSDMKEFQRSHHFLLNIAVGGTLPGNPDDTSVFPQTMYVDYVRVYEKDGFTPDPEPPVDVNEETVGGSAGEADINQAIQAGFNAFGTGLELNRFGAGGEPSYSNSDDAIDGSQSVEFAYPGEAFGGAWIMNEAPVDLTVYAQDELVFAIKKPSIVANLEVKLEGDDGSAASMFLINYTSTDLGNGWEEYRIPIADIVSGGLSLDQVTIPFALWNPVDADGNFPEVNILFDAIRIE